MDDQKAKRERRKMLADKRQRIERELALAEIEQELAETEDNDHPSNSEDQDNMEDTAKVFIT